MQNYQIRQIKWLIVFIFVGVFVHATALPLFNSNGPIHFTKLVSAQESKVSLLAQAFNPLMQIPDRKISTANKASIIDSIDNIEKYDAYIDKALEKYPTVDKQEVIAIILTESQGNHLAYNTRTDARGLGQITPIALEDISRLLGTSGSTDRFDPQTNINMTVQTLWILENMYGIDDPVVRVGAYNEGAAGSEKYNGDFDDHLYVQKVAFAYQNI